MKELILLILLCFFSCAKQNCLREFEFHFPATITEGNIFHIGDTLWIEMDISNQLIDHQTGEVIDLSQLDLYFNFGISKIDTSYIYSATRDFELVEKVGNFSQIPNRFTLTNIYFKQQDDRHFHVGIIPKKRGAFLLTVELPLEYGIAELAEKEEDRLKIIDSPCTYQDITRYSGVRFNSGAINHYLIASYPCRQSSPSDPTQFCTQDSTLLANRGGYAFVVQ